MCGLLVKFSGSDVFIIFRIATYTDMWA